MCTTSRATRVVVALTLAVLIIEAINFISFFMLKVYIINSIIAIVFILIVPMTVLIINMVVVREVCRRASNDAAASLGLQHQQSTTFNSAVPTVMLVTSSLVYFLLFGMSSIGFLLVVVFRMNIESNVYVYYITRYASRFAYAYNFYVYLITGRQFRSELHKLFSSCYSSSSSAAADVANVDVSAVRRCQADTNV